MEPGAGSHDWRLKFDLARNAVRSSLLTKVTAAEQKIFSQATSQDHYNAMVLDIYESLERFPKSPLLNFKKYYSVANPSVIGQVPGPTQQAEGSNLPSGSAGVPSGSAGIPSGPTSGTGSYFLCELRDKITSDWLFEQERMLEQLTAASMSVAVGIIKFDFMTNGHSDEFLFSLWKDLMKAHANELIQTFKDFQSTYLQVFHHCYNKEASSCNGFYQTVRKINQELNNLLAIIQVTKLASAEHWAMLISDFQISAPLFLRETKRQVEEIDLHVKQHLKQAKGKRKAIEQ